MSRRPQWIPHRGDAAGMILAGAVGALAIAAMRVLPPTPFLSDILIALTVGALVLNTPLRRVIGLERPSAEREPDRYAAGLRFVGKWVLRAAIILLGFKLQAKLFGLGELAIIGGVAAASLPSTFLFTHAIGARLGVRRPMVDLIAGGTMICGASAVNALAPVARARRQEQGIAIAAIFLFSVVALLVFRPVATALGLDAAHAGLWSGLAVNDLSSAIAVGKQFGTVGGVMASAAKSTRVLLLAPMLIAVAFLRSDGAPRGTPKGILAHLPRFLFGYLGLAGARALGDRLFGDAGWWSALGAWDKTGVDFLMATVAAGIGLHLELGKLLAAGGRALALGGAASLWMAGLSLAMVASAARGAVSTAILVGGVALVASYLAYRASNRAATLLRALKRRFTAGAPLTLGEATRVLDAFEEEGTLDDAPLRQLLAQLHPAIGELIPVRESPLPHGEGCRWVTYWEGKSGWALVAVCRDPGSATPIHAHPHRLIGKTIEGVLEELRFVERPDHALELATRKLLGHNDLVETDGLATLHVVRALGDSAAIDLQLRGPEVGLPGRRFRTAAPIDFAALRIGERLLAVDEIDDRPGQAGEGASAGRAPGAGAAS